MSTDKKYRIVLVEDEDILSNLLAQKLEDAGYAVEIARDGEQGLQAILNNRPDLVLLDMMLPKLNGFSILEQLAEKKMLPDLPVVVISNSGQPVEIERAQKLGIRDYLVKLNFDPDEVLEKVKYILSPETEKTTPQQTPGLPKSGQMNGEILVVEDDMFIADLLVRKLNEKFNVHHAPDAMQAANILKERHIDLICLDIILPGEDGYTFLKKIKADETLKSIPVLILSNLGQKEEVDRGIQAGAADYLIKANMSPDEILEHVDQLLKKSKEG